MKIIGALLVIYGIAALVLNYLAMNVIGFDWMGMFAPDVAAWMIGAAFVVLGLIFWIIGGMGGAKSTA